MTTHEALDQVEGRKTTWPGREHTGLHHQLRQTDASKERGLPAPVGRTTLVLEIADGLEMDLAAHKLRRDGHPVHLRPKEFQLLAMLAAHPGPDFTWRQLLERVWGRDQVGDPRTVDVRVRWLRATGGAPTRATDPSGHGAGDRLPAGSAPALTET